ncbi:unnamed protein product, partial [Rotaria sp. Silwood2]
MIPRQRISTRFFIVLFTITTVIIGFVIFQSIQTQTITIWNPSLNTYAALYNKYSTTLLCPCSQISVPYEAFFNITYTLHKICSSDLLSPAWLEFILAYHQTFTVYDSAGYFQRDFRSIGASYFQLLATFCSIAKEIIDEALLTLAKAQFVNDRVISKSYFIQQMQNLNNTYTNSIRKEFLITKEWLYTTAQTNQLLNSLENKPKTLLKQDHCAI